MDFAHFFASSAAIFMEGAAGECLKESMALSREKI